MRTMQDMKRLRRIERVERAAIPGRDRYRGQARMGASTRTAEEAAQQCGCAVGHGLTIQAFEARCITLCNMRTSNGNKDRQDGAGRRETSRSHTPANRMDDLRYAQAGPALATAGSCGRCRLQCLCDL